MQIKIVPNQTGNPPGKVADAEIHFTYNDGPLSGLKLIGFGIWERRSGTGRNVTFPARQYQINGERRSFAVLRPIADGSSQDAIVRLILAAFDAHQADPDRCAFDILTDAAGNFGISLDGQASVWPIGTHTDQPIAAPSAPRQTDAERGINVPPTAPPPLKLAPAPHVPSFDF